MTLEDYVECILDRDRKTFYDDLECSGLEILNNKNKTPIIADFTEYSPLHNGHLYLLETIKKQFPNDPIIIVLGGNFLERGEVSILNKWQKTELSLNHHCDLVIELPFPFACQSADYFAHGAISILKELK